MTVASRHGPVQVTRKVYNEQAGAETPPQPDIPVAGEHVWAWWWQLNARRQPGFDTLAPLTYTEIKSWIELTGKNIEPIEVDWLIQMDNAWLDQIATERKDKQDRDDAKRERQGAK